MYSEPLKGSFVGITMLSINRLQCGHWSGVMSYASPIMRGLSHAISVRASQSTVFQMIFKHFEQTGKNTIEVIPLSDIHFAALSPSERYHLLKDAKQS